MAMIASVLPAYPIARQLVLFGQATLRPSAAAEVHEVTPTDPVAGLSSAVFALVPAWSIAVITHLADVHPTE